MDYLEMKALLNNEISKANFSMFKVIDILTTYKNQGENEYLSLLVACETFGVSYKLVISGLVKQEHVYARDFYCLYMHLNTTKTLYFIGTKINREHSSVTAAIKRMRAKIIKSDKLANKWQEFTEKIKALTAVEAA